MRVTIPLSAHVPLDKTKSVVPLGSKYTASQLLPYLGNPGQAADDRGWRMAVIARYSAKEHVKGPLRSILFTALTLAIPYAEKATAQVYINDGLDGACQRIVDTGGSSIEAKVSSQCNEDPWNVTLYTRFFGSSTAAGDQGGASRSLVLGGVLYVNGGQVGINDVLNKTYSLRMGSVATMNAAVGANAIAHWLVAEQCG